MTLLRKSTAIASALTLLASSALAQTEASPPAAAPTPEQGAAQPQPHDMNGQGTDAMREMMREMMEMMQGKQEVGGERGSRAERGDGDRWHHGPRMDRKMRDGSGMREAGTT